MIRVERCGLASGVGCLPHYGKFFVGRKSQVREARNVEIFRSDRAKAFDNGSRQSNIFVQPGIQPYDDVVHRDGVRLETVHFLRREPSIWPSKSAGFGPIARNSFRMTQYSWNVASDDECRTASNIMSCMNSYSFAAANTAISSDVNRMDPSSVCPIIGTKTCQGSMCARAGSLRSAMHDLK